MPHLRFDREEEVEASVVINGSDWAIYLRDKRSSDPEGIRIAQSGTEGMKAGVYAYTTGTATVYVEGINGLTVQYRVDAIEHIQDTKKPA